MIISKQQRKLDKFISIKDLKESREEAEKANICFGILPRKKKQKIPDSQFLKIIE